MVFIYQRTVRYGYPHSYHGAQGPTRRARTHVVEIIAHNKSNQKPSTGNGAFNARRDASMAQLVSMAARRVGRRSARGGVGDRLQIFRSSGGVWCARMRFRCEAAQRFQSVCVSSAKPLIRTPTQRAKCALLHIVLRYRIIHGDAAASGRALASDTQLRRTP